MTKKTLFSDKSKGALPPIAITKDSESLRRCSSSVARSKLSYELAMKMRALPLGVLELFGTEVLSIAISTNPNSNKIAELQFATGMEVKLIQVDRQILESAIFTSYHGDDRTLKTGIEALQNVEKVEQTNSISKIEFRPESGEVAQFLATLIDYGIANQASDIHLIPKREGAFVKLRINGQLLSHKNPICSRHSQSQLISRLRVLSGLDTTTKGLPQDGAFNLPVGTSLLTIRLSIMPTIHGDKAVLRVGNLQDALSLSELELDTTTSAFVSEFLSMREGAMFCAGPTGSGKTTTLYAIVEELAKRNLSIVSIEDPVERELSEVTQTSINVAKSLSYAHSLRAVLRQDPDVILIGEIRDGESAEVALQAALTGHLVLSTVHARSTTEVFLRLKNLGADSLTISQALRLVTCQRLLPKLCRNCRVIDLIGSKAANATVYKHVGCDLCDYSGFAGRTLASESLRVNTSTTRKIIKENLGYAELRNQLSSAVFRSMEESLKKLLVAGKIEGAQFADYSRRD